MYFVCFYFVQYLNIVLFTGGGGSHFLLYQINTVITCFILIVLVFLVVNPYTSH